MARWYGSVVNRIEEGRNYSKREIQVGDDITMYLWSDRYCYYVTEVIDQKHIKVREYEVVADHSKNIGMGHQEWLYFKTRKEANAYLNQYFPDTYEENPIESPEEDWVFRYGKWVRMTVFTKENYCTERELKSLKKKGYYNRYSELSGKISFGVRNYYYDWSF